MSSCPAVSHHLRILEDAGIIRVRRKGTKNYYSFHSDCGEIEALLQMLQQARVIMRQPAFHLQHFEDKVLAFFIAKHKPRAAA